MRSWVVVLCIAAACGSHASKLDEPPPPSKDIPLGLDLRLSNGTQGAPAVDRATLAPAKHLGDADAAALLARAAPIEAAAGDAKAFALRPGSQPPPRAGATITESFPPSPLPLPSPG